MSSLHAYRYASPFYYASGAQPLGNGLGPGYALALVLSVAIPSVLVVTLFNRRDLAT